MKTYQLTDAFDLCSGAQGRSQSLTPPAHAPSSLPGTQLMLHISKPTKIEETLRESEEKFRVLFEHAGDYVYVLDTTPAGGRDILDANQAACQMHGFTYEELVGKPVAELDGEENKRRVAERAARIMAGERVIFETVHHSKDGSSCPVEVCAMRVERAGRPPVAFAIERDITARKQAKEALQALEAEKARFEAQNGQLQKAESLGRMAGAIAHNFNNLLGAVMGNLELAMTDIPGGAEHMNKLAEAMKAASRAAEVSGQMLAYIGQTPGKHEALDLSEACRRSLPMLRVAMAEKGDLKTDLPFPGPTIKANASQIQQVLSNLATNAWEALGEGRGAISLAVKRVAAADIPAKRRFPLGWHPQERLYACLEVTDAGCGIAEKDIDELFDPFFTSKFIGRGLGLPVVLGVVGAHNGAVTVESEAGRGSVLRAFFPITSEEIPRPLQQAARAPEIQRGGTVLLVEDEPEVREITKAMITHMGFTVLEAKDGAEAIEMFRQHKDNILCVLSDLTMPRMDGWETLTALRQLSPGIPVILSSGYDQSQVMSGEHDQWPQVFLGKPYGTDGVRDAIHKVLENGAATWASR